MSVELLLILIIVLLVLGTPRLSVPENLKTVLDVVIYVLLAVVAIKFLLTLL